MPPGIAEEASSPGKSEIIASVVSSKPAIDAAFCKAARVTFAGSITPAFTRSSSSSVRALNPTFSFFSARTSLGHDRFRFKISRFFAP